MTHPSLPCPAAAPCPANARPLVSSREWHVLDTYHLTGVVRKRSSACCRPPSATCLPPLLTPTCCASRTCLATERFSGRRHRPVFPISSRRSRKRKQRRAQSAGRNRDKRGEAKTAATSARSGGHAGGQKHGAATKATAEARGSAGRGGSGKAQASAYTAPRQHPPEPQPRTHARQRAPKPTGGVEASPQPQPRTPAARTDAVSAESGSARRARVPVGWAGQRADDGDALDVGAWGAGEEVNPLEMELEVGRRPGDPPSPGLETLDDGGMDIARFARERADPVAAVPPSLFVQGRGGAGVARVRGGNNSNNAEEKGEATGAGGTGQGQAKRGVELSSEGVRVEEEDEDGEDEEEDGEDEEETEEGEEGDSSEDSSGEEEDDDDDDDEGEDSDEEEEDDDDEEDSDEEEDDDEDGEGDEDDGDDGGNATGAEETGRATAEPRMRQGAVGAAKRSDGRRRGKGGREQKAGEEEVEEEGSLSVDAELEPIARRLCEEVRAPRWRGRARPHVGTLTSRASTGVGRAACSVRAARSAVPSERRARAQHMDPEAGGQEPWARDSLLERPRSNPGVHNGRGDAGVCARTAHCRGTARARRARASLRCVAVGGAKVHREPAAGVPAQV